LGIGNEEIFERREITRLSWNDFFWRLVGEFEWSFEVGIQLEE
jgi:hypothetical protein